MAKTKTHIFVMGGKDAAYEVTTVCGKYKRPKLAGYLMEEVFHVFQRQDAPPEDWCLSCLTLVVDAFERELKAIVSAKSKKRRRSA